MLLFKLRKTTFRVLSAGKNSYFHNIFLKIFRLVSITFEKFNWEFVKLKQRCVHSKIINVHVSQLFAFPTYKTIFQNFTKIFAWPGCFPLGRQCIIKKQKPLGLKLNHWLHEIMMRDGYWHLYETRRCALSISNVLFGKLAQVQIHYLSMRDKQYLTNVTNQNQNMWINRIE